MIHNVTRSVFLNDRSAVVAWPWVVGDFETTDGLGCDDIAYGEASQVDPRVMSWKLFRATDSNSNGLCDNLVYDGEWEDDWGVLGRRYVFAADAGRGAADDIIMVTVPVTSGVEEANWSIAYSNGSTALTDIHWPLAGSNQHYISGAENHWTGMVFGVGDFNGANGVDFITLRGANSTGAVKARIAYRAAGTGSWTLGSFSTDTVLPTAKAAWDQPSEDMPDGLLDDGGDDAAGTWWCTTCDAWFCQWSSSC